MSVMRALCVRTYVRHIWLNQNRFYVLEYKVQLIGSDTASIRT